MANSDRILTAFREQIEVKFLRAIRKGWLDVAVIVDVQNQDQLRRQASEQRGSPVDAFVGVVISGDRITLSDALRQRFPGHEAPDSLANDTLPPGRFPVVIVSDRGITFFSLPKPESTDAPEPVQGFLYEGQVSDLRIELVPAQVIVFKLRGNATTLVADNRFLGKVHPGDKVHAVCRMDASGNATVLDMLRCGPDQTIPDEAKQALLAKFGASFD